MSRLFLPLLAAMLLGGCATGYHDAANPILGYTGGYWDAPGPGQLIKVGFSGNGFIKKEQVGIYVLYRCAEVAQSHGKDYFVMYDNLPAAILDKRSAERNVGTLGGKPSAYVYILLRDQDGVDVLSAKAILDKRKQAESAETAS